MNRNRQCHPRELWENKWLESNIIKSSCYPKMKGNRIGKKPETIISLDYFGEGAALLRV